MKYIIFLFALVLILGSCTTNNNPVTGFPGISTLKKQLFRINSDKDTSLLTLHGSVIRVMAGSFSISGQIDLEIREALTAAEILVAGLVTESNGRPLRSAGMIFLDARKGNKKPDLLKPIRISMPNDFFDPTMKLFKGKQTEDGTINWVDPQPLDSTRQQKNWQLGEQLFKSKCASCHNVFKESTGPSLAGIDERIPDRSVLHHFINNPAGMMAHNPYFNCQRLQYGSMMTAFPELSAGDMDAIIDYINAEAASQPEKRRSTLDNSPPDKHAVADTTQKFICNCGTQTVYIAAEKKDIPFFETDTLPVSNTVPVQLDDTPQKLEEIEKREIQFTDPKATSGMYDFEIRTMGWFNIDAFMEGYIGTTPVKLAVRLQMEFDIAMHVYLFCPDKQILSVAYNLENGLYPFDKIDGKVPLFLNNRAIIFAFGSQADSMYYGITEFNIQGEQIVDVSIKKTNPEEIKKALLVNKMNGIDLGIEVKEKKTVDRPCNEGRPAITTDSINVKEK